ncbi:hypothetical protein BDZ91DRAFT_724481 [Kalaharituber pfeilii]|nr:hypothetical protein BDZ91DRAFT_724481 [Kalaharituber pfeilii]
MSSDILREFDTLYAQKPTATASSTQPSSNSFFFDAFGSTPAAPPASASNPLGDGYLPPQRPSSVQLAYRGTVPNSMARNHSNPLATSSGTSSFDDLVGLLSGTPPAASNVKQANGRPASFHGLNRLNTGSKDPFAALAGSSGLRYSFTPQSATQTPFNRSSFGSNGKSNTSKTITSTTTTSAPPDDDDFGDFASASTVPIKTPTIPTQAFQNSSNGYRRPLSITTTPNYSALSSLSSSIPAKSPLKNATTITTNTTTNNTSSNLSLLTSDSLSSINNLDTSADDDFGEFIQSPAKPTFGSIALPKPTPPPSTRSTAPSIPLSIKPLPPSSLSIPSITAAVKKPPLASKPSPPLPELPSLSVILAPFPTIFTQPTTCLFSKLTQHPYPLRQRILSDPKTRGFLLGTCEAARVAGRIVAGRKARRNMGRKIGSIAGANKDIENQKEEREIAELVRIWKEEIGRMKAALVAPSSKGTGTGHSHSNSDPSSLSSLSPSSLSSSSTSSPSIRVPELDTDLKAEKMPLPGVVIDMEVDDRPCLLCGLRQDEVVRKLFEGEFGRGDRWWKKGWGHRGCWRWWEKWEDELRKGGVAMGGKGGQRGGGRRF